MKYLLRYEIGDGYGEHTICTRHYVIDTNSFPIVNGYLTEEAKSELKSHYGKDNRLSGMDSPYNNWYVVKQGEEAGKYFDLFIKTRKAIKLLKENGYTDFF